MESDTITIRPTKGWRNINFRELWHYRELLYFFTLRDVKVRYKQTYVGVLWAIIQPVLTMLVFTVFFGKLAKVPSNNIPYPIFVYTGLLPWTLFSQALTRSAQSVVSYETLVKKVYFPRLITPVSASLLAMVDFIVSFSILIIMMLYYQYVPSFLNVLFFIGLVFLSFLCAVGAGFWLCAINVLYRDVRYIIPFIIQLGLFLTPVIYPTNIVPEQYKFLLYLNPMAGLIEGMRSVLLGQPEFPVLGLLMSVVITGVLFISGTFFFTKMEKTFADVI